MTAASRILPSQDAASSLPFDALDWQNKAHREVSALWQYGVVPLTSVAGTNTVTASIDTSVVVTISAYAKGMKFSIVPAVTNTGSVTLNIDSKGAIAVKDVDGNALAAGAFLAGRMYTLEYDGTNFRKYDGSLLTISSGVPMIVRDEKATNSNGGAFNSGSYVKRTLNTVLPIGAISGSSLANSQITLPAGSYYVEWSAPAFSCNRHQTRLFNATDSTVTETGDSAYSVATAQAVAQGCANFTISSAKAFELQHICETTSAGGLGVETNRGAKEVYAVVRIWKVDVALPPVTGPSSITYTTASQTIDSSTRDVFFNLSAAGAFTLPDASAWNAANGLAEMLLKDISGAASTNNITINRAGANTIDGATSIVLGSNFGAIKLRVSPTSNWMQVA